ncbi:hypothetical protein BC332_06523 [Capsicum chinense]|nr:hypothetical protein BC332_06523 [Capsicum chinense]
MELQMESVGDEASHQHGKRHQPTIQTSDSILTLPILPLELITEILVRLPVKSLLKFKSVSKSWLALISSPDFIKNHLNLSANNKDNTYHRIILRDSHPPRDPKVCPLRSLLDGDFVTEAYDFDYPMKNTTSCFWTVGSVNGLICLEVVYIGLFIWNPTIRKYKTLADHGTELNDDDTCSYGFGYDEVHDDYKVVGLFFIDNGDYPYDVTVKIYSLKSDSWRQIDGFQSADLASDFAKSIYGKIHWMTSEGEIIFIDLVDEKWATMNHPCYGEDLRLKLGVFGSDLSIFTSSAELWVLKEYGVEESWENILTIKTHDIYDIRPLFIKYGCRDQRLVADGLYVWILLLRFVAKKLVLTALTKMELQMESVGDEASHQHGKRHQPTIQTSDSILTLPILPLELITEILVRLPVKSLLKFKSVSKSWLALISFEHLQGVLNQLSGMGVKFDEEIQGLWLLNTLPDSWETLRVSLTNSTPSGIVTMEYVKSGVLNEEMRRRSQASSSSSSHSDVLVTEERGRNKSRDSNDRDKSRSKSRSKFKNVTCDYCNKKGHIMKYCYKHKRDIRRQKKEGDNENRVVVVANDDLLVACGENAINLVRDESSWFVDSGATSHVTPKKELSSSYTPGNFGMLKMGNNDKVKVLGIGTVLTKNLTF